MNRRIITFLLLLNVIWMVPVNISGISFDEAPFAYLYYSDFSSIKQDGAITENEYPDTITLYDVAGDLVNELAWAHNSTSIAIGMTIEGTGWLGIGFGPIGIGMAGSNIIMAAVSSNKLIINDMYSLKQGKPQIDDDQYDFLNANGTEVNGKTVIEFIIPLQSNDKDGKDHNWNVNGTYGFFTAYRKSGDNFGFQHHSHSESLTVKILDSSFSSPQTTNQNFDVNIDTKDMTVTLLTHLLTNGSLSGQEIGFYKKSLFGKVLIGIAITDDKGIAQVTVPIDKTGEVTYITLFAGNEFLKRNEEKKTITINITIETTEKEYGDLRDTIGERFIRSFMLTGFYIIILILLYVYITLIVGWVNIFQIGKKYDIEKKEDMEFK